mgnify:CR=1 FL=1
MNRFQLSFLLICLICFTCCTKLSKERLYMIEDNGRFGYISEIGDTIVPCIYPLAYTDTIKHIGFVAERDGKILCIDYKGNELFYVFKYDNGPDYPNEGLFRIVNENGIIGFADTLGKVIIAPDYKFAFPFKNGKAKVTREGQLVNKGEHCVWESPSWIYIDNPLMKKED